MYQEGLFNVIPFYPPVRGMNRNLSPEALTSEFAYHLENFIPRPLGRLSLRYGNRKIDRVDPDTIFPLDARIIEQFPFQKSAFEKQSILYARVYVKDESLSNVTFISASQFSFKTDNPTQYRIDEEVKLKYTKNLLAQTFEAYVSSVVVSGNGKKTVTLSLEDNFFPSDIQNIALNEISYSSGSIFVQDLTTNQITLLKENMSVSCVPRSATFLQTLLMVNGVDPMLSWEGTKLNIVGRATYIKETQIQNARKITYTNGDKAIVFLPSESTLTLDQIKARYSTVKIIINDKEIILEVISVRKTQIDINGEIKFYIEILIINNKDFFKIANNTIFDLYYNVGDGSDLPRFSYIFAAHDRLWALGAGTVGLEYRNPNDALRVFFAYKANSIKEWINENTNSVPSIDLSAKHGVPDNLEAITLVNGYLAFIGRKKTQVYRGLDPVGKNAPDPFVWHATLPVGVYHGNLINNLANDSYFISESGALSFGTLNAAQQFAVSPVNAMDPLIQEQIASIKTNRAYRACRSFVYPTGSFCGFKIGNNKPLIGLYDTNIYAWTLFSGDFQRASSFLPTLDQSLYLSIDNDIYRYGDGSISPPFYTDRGGQDMINFLCVWPNSAFEGKRYANKRYEIQAEHGSSFFLNPRNTMQIGIDGDLRRSFSLESKYSFSYRGDPLGTTPFLAEASVNPYPIVNDKPLGLHLDESFAPLKGRLKFVSSQFWLSVFGTANNGPFAIKQIKLYGTVER